MEALLSELTKKPFKNWKNLFQAFLTEPILHHAQQNDDGLSLFLMGLFHEQGSMLEKNYDLAIQYFRQGANKRDPLCLYKLYEIHSGKNYYGIEPDKEIAFLYLVWAVTYMFPIYGSYMCLDLDLELQSYYKTTLKQNKEQVFLTIDEYEDDIFAHDKDLIKSVFGFLVEFISPVSGSGFNAQEQYQKMVDSLIEMAEKGDSRFPALFLFKCVLWDFKGVTDKKHQKIMSLIRNKKCVSFILEQLKSVFDYITLLDKKHTIFSRLIHFHSVEIFLQIKYNCDYDDIPNQEEALEYIANFLYNSIGLMDNNYTRSMAIYFRAKACMSRNRQDPDRDLNQAINVIESSRQLSGFSEQDFPFILGGRLYSKAGNNAMSASYFEKYINYSSSPSNLPVKFYEQGQYFEHCKRNDEKAIESYLKGIYPAAETNSFLQECYAAKCKAKISKLINADNELCTRLHSPLEKAKLFSYNE